MTDSHVAGLLADSCAWMGPLAASGTPAWACSTTLTTLKLEADITRKPPAARVTAGRTCGIRMKGPALLFVAPAETSIQYVVALAPEMLGLQDASPLDTRPTSGRQPQYSRASPLARRAASVMSVRRFQTPVRFLRRGNLPWKMSCMSGAGHKIRLVQD